jgi:hypothetical protein
MDGETAGEALDRFSGDPEWRQRVNAAAEEASRKRVAKAVRRAKLQVARSYGLASRHAAKLARRPPDKP